MKLRFKVQDYQTSAVHSVIDCFAGQVNNPGLSYRVAPGAAPTTAEYIGIRNAAIHLTDVHLVENIQAVQRRQGLVVSERLVSSAGIKVNLDVEMETGTGKTYCYIKTIFEMSKQYGWSRFIVMVPSIAIREGVLKAMEITAEHFAET